jgi:hypothetical protein
VPRWGLEESDDSNVNVFAQAYIRPAYDLVSGDAPFNLNIDLRSDPNGTLRSSEAMPALEYGQDVSPRFGFAVAYLMAAYQAGDLFDVDPNEERIAYGLTSPGIESDVGRTRGTFVFLEPSAEQHELPIPGIVSHCIARTIVHELGHQFLVAPHDGVGHAVMSSGCFDGDLNMTPIYFLAVHLQQIRANLRY